MPASARTASNRAGYLPSRSRIRYSDPASGVVEVHDEVAGGLGYPGRGWMRGRAEDPDAAGGVFDDGQHVQPGAGQGCRLEEVGGE